jgi:hypothetical protein
MKNLIKIYVFAGISLLIISCGTTTRLPNQGNVKSPIDMPNYIITLSDEKDWEDWEMEILEGNLGFKKLRPLPTSGKIVAISMMSVMTDTIEASLLNLTREQLVDTLVYQYLNYWKIFADTVDGELEDVNISTIQHKDKNLSVLEMELIRSSAWSLSFTVEWNYEITTYYYLPENYLSDKCFYIFEMLEHYQPGSILPVDMEPILEIIDGFELKK